MKPSMWKRVQEVVGTFVKVNKGHSWAGQTGKVIRWDNIVQGYLVELKNGITCTIRFPFMMSIISNRKNKHTNKDFVYTVKFGFIDGYKLRKRYEKDR